MSGSEGEKMILIKATGNTYSVKENLKKAGFTWDSEMKAWTTIKFDKDAWDKQCNPTYSGRGVAKFCMDVKFENIEMDI
jgi:hypothetical protein